jgi:hypothetical protein
LLSVGLRELRETKAHRDRRPVEGDHSFEIGITSKDPADRKDVIERRTRMIETSDGSGRSSSGR